MTSLGPASSGVLAEWIKEGIRSLDSTVGSLIPDGYESYLGFLHPPPDRTGSAPRGPMCAMRCRSASIPS